MTLWLLAHFSYPVPVTVFFLGEDSGAPSLFFLELTAALIVLCAPWEGFRLPFNYSATAGCSSKAPLLRNGSAETPGAARVV